MAGPNWQIGIVGNKMSAISSMQKPIGLLSRLRLKVFKKGPSQEEIEAKDIQLVQKFCNLTLSLNHNLTFNQSATPRCSATLKLYARKNCVVFEKKVVVIVCV